MFNIAKRHSNLGSALRIFELIFHSIVRSVRAKHNNALLAILLNMLQIAIFVLAFYVMFSMLGLRGTAIRGDFLIYILSGIFLYMTHIKTLGAVTGAPGPTNPMMLHAPMNTIVAIAAAALGALYIQLLSLFVLLFIYHVAFTPVVIYDWVGAFAMLLLAWFTGGALGLVFLALKPWFPTAIGVITTVYQRANMIASGKMFLANSLPSFMLAMFDWNPLFHCIDQARGYAFINYFPRYSSWEYAFWVGVIFLVLGLMGEFYTRRHVSVSWGARR
jgi:ABC-type polysaccharide/polyol phosphate export permease